MYLSQFTGYCFKKAPGVKPCFSSISVGSYNILLSMLLYKFSLLLSYACMKSLIQTCNFFFYSEILMILIGLSKSELHHLKSTRGPNLGL